MFRPLSKRINGAGSSELVTYSADRLPDYSGRKILVPTMRMHTNPDIYYEFVRGLEASRDGAYVLPPVPVEAMWQDVFRDFLSQVQASYGKNVSFHQMGGSESGSGSCDVMILNCDPVEVHGSHLPLGTDDFRASGLCRILAGKVNDLSEHGIEPCDLGDVNVVNIPSLSYGYAGTAERSKRGTIGLDSGTLKRMIVNYLSRAVSDYRPGKVFVFTSHAHPGHFHAIDNALERLDDDFGGTEFYRVFDFHLLDKFEPETRGHAAWNETMVMMGYDRLLGTSYVDVERAEGDVITRPAFRRHGIEACRDLCSEWNGVNGFGNNNPERVREDTEASYEKGIEWIDEMLENAEDLILSGEELELKAS
jgi:creatinine amidohydrolase/Fe(II)-dependent formamide hydrolase-like protein